MKIKRFIYLITLLLLPFWLLAQTNISNVEYWYDGDYGTAVQQTVTPGLSVSYTDLLDVSSLEPGLHTFTVRFQDTRGIWGSVLTQFFTYYPESSSGIHEVTDAEYWYDGDYTSAVEIPLTSGLSVDLTTLLDVSSLEPGLHTFTARFKDTQGIWSSVLTQFFTYYPESSSGIHEVTDAEYWFDGNYASVVEVPITPGMSADLNELLDVSALITGLHTVTFRFKDDREIWSSPMIRFFKKEGTSGLKQLVAAEYWFNDDYASKHDSSFVATSSLDLAGMLDITNLRGGFNFVSLRVQDEAGKWGPVASWYFTKEDSESLPQLHQITALEYWYDGDYSSVQNDPVSATAQLTLDIDLDVSALDDGLHVVSTRYCDEAGNWSPVYSSFFTKYPEDAAADMHEITEIEYWFDGDYSSIQNDPLSTTSQLDLNTLLDVSALSDGLHIASIRFKDEGGNWSPAFSHLFSKFPAEAVAEIQQLVSVEYWIDGDVATTVKSALPPASDYLLDTQLDLSALSDGLHLISYRFQDEAGVWSAAFSHLFSKYEDEVLPADNKIVAYRYWANNMISSATEVTLTTPVQTLDLDELLDVSNFPGGEHLASFQFQDEQGQWSSALGSTYQKEVNPTLSISAFDSSVCVGTPVVFAADYTDADAIVWKFGDGSTSNEFSPVHSYSDEGVFEVTAIVTYTDSMKSAYDTLVGGITVYPLYRTWLGDADTIFYDSFESETTGTAPSNWIMRYYGTGAANQIVVESTVKNGVKAFQMEGASGWAAEFYKRFANLPEKVTIEGWVNCEKTLSGIAGSIGLGNFDIGTWGTRTSRLEFTAGKFVATYSGGSSYIIMDYTPGTWYHVRMVHDLADLTYQVYINNVLVSGDNGSGSTNVFPMHPSVSTQDAMLCAGNTGITKVWFDDIVIDEEGVLEVCASDLPFVLGSQNIVSEGYYTETFASVNGCDSVVSVNLTINSTGSSTQYDTICESELPYSFGSQSITAGGTFIENIPTGAGCDSLVTLYLMVKDTFVVSEEVTVCETDLPYIFGGTELNASGDYTEVFPSENGCDSTVTLALIVIDTSLTEIELSVCENELPLIIATDTFYTGGIYTKTLNNTLGCDSTVILTLNVLDTSLVTEEIEICEGSLPFTFGTQVLSTGGVYSEVFTSENGCDSTVVLTLNVSDTFIVSDEVTVCESDLPYLWEGDELTTSGSYTKVLSSSEGCDSTVNLQFTVNDTSLLTLDLTLCESDLPYIFGSQSLTIGGSYTEVFTAENGCDSTVVLSLNVNDTLRTNLDISVCELDLPYIFGVRNLTTGGIYSDTLTNSSGCDSVVVLTLTMNDTFIISDEFTICESELPYEWEGDQLTISGSYTKTLSSINGCDSTVTLTLNVKDSALTYLEASVCESELPFTLGTQSLTSSGSFTEVFAAENGCDSTVILTLNVLDTSLIAESVDVCESDLPYILGTQTLTSSGTYTEVFAGENGCDSTIILALTVNDTFNIEDTVTVCENDLPFTFGGQDLITDGIYTEVFNSVSGCDSTVVLVFAVNDTFSLAFTDTVCENELPYILGSQSIISEGSYTEIFTAENGCDSVVTLTLSINPSYTTHLYDTVSQSELPYIFGSQSLTKTGVYSDVYTTVNGCDSVITMHLLVGDVIPPVAVCHSLSVELSADGSYTLSDADLLALARGSNDDVTDTDDLRIQVTPAEFTCEDLGDIVVTVRVFDAAGNKASCQTILHVLDAVSSPEIDAVSGQIIEEDQILFLDLTGISGGSSCEDWPVSISAETSTSDLVDSIHLEYEPYESTASLQIIPIANQSGTDSIFITVEDSLGNSTTINFLLTVNKVNDDPLILQEIEDFVMNTDDSVTITISKIPGDYFEDNDDSSLVFRFTVSEMGVPDWVNIEEDEQQLILTFTPTVSDTGCFEAVLSIEDETGAVVNDTFQICIDFEVGISQPEEKVFEVNLYPNPTRGSVNIDLNNPPSGEIELLVTSITGSEVLRKTYQSGERIVFDLSHHIGGSYLVILQLNQQRIVRKIILDKK